MPATHTLALSGEVDMPAVERFSAGLLAEVAALRAELLIVDVSAVTFIDNSGIAMLEQLRDQQAGHEGRIALHGASPMLMKILGITGMDQVLPVYGRLATTTGPPVDPDC